MDVKGSTVAFGHCNSINKCEAEVMSSEGDGTCAGTIQHFSCALSDYIQFLRDWSRTPGTPSNASHLDSGVNLFIPGINNPEDIIGDALPAVRFKEAVERLRNSVNEHSLIQQEHELDAQFEDLEILEDMARTHYQNACVLDILDQRIILLRALLALNPTSHPEREHPHLKLGEAFIVRFTHTDELDDLDSAISHYSKAHLVGVDQYSTLQGLTLCLLTRFDRTQNVVDLHKASSAVDQALSDMDVYDPSHYAYLCNLGFLLMERYQQNITAHGSSIEQAISYYRDVLLSCPTTPSSNLHTLQSIINNFSVVLLKGYDQSDIQIDADDMVNLLRNFMLLDPNTSPVKHNLLSHQLTKLLLIATYNREYSNEMLSVVRQFTNFKPLSDIQHYLALRALSTILVTRFGLLKNADNLDEAIAVYRDALPFALPYKREIDRVQYLNMLANMLVKRFQISGTEEDSKDITAIYHDILGSSILDPIKLQTTMKEYADFLALRFIKHSNPEYIHEAISMYRAALDLVSQNEGQSPNKGNILFELYQALLMVAEKEDEKEEAHACLNDAIDCLRTSVMLPEGDTERLTEARRLLSVCLLARSHANSDPDDINESVELSQDDKVQGYNIMFDIRNTMVLDINKLHDPQELENMIQIFRKTLTKEPFAHPKRPETLVSLGKALSSLFRFGGAKKQLNEAILHLREAVVLAPKSAVARLALSDVLLQKEQLQEHSSTADYLEEAKVHIRKCVSLIPTQPGQHSKRLLEQILKQLNNNFDSSELDHIPIMQELNLGKDLFDKARNMSLQLWLSFKISSDMKALDESIHYAREAAAVCPENYPHGAAVFHDLGSKLFRRYQDSKDLEDIDKALHSYFKGIEKLPPDHYLYSLYVGDFWIASILRILGHMEDMTEILTSISNICMLFRAGAMGSTSSPVPESFRAAKIRALLADACNHDSTLEVYEQAISLLPRLSSMATNIASRQETFKISSIDGLSRNAALFAIKIGKYNKAIEFLEAGRAVFWLQALQLRSPMDKLRDAAPNLYVRLSKISMELDRASMRMNAPCAPDNNAEKLVQDKELFQLENLNEEWQRTVDEVRELEEFQDFLLPPKISGLQKSIDKTVIFLIPGEQRSHALVMSINEVKHIGLSDAPYDKLHELVAYLPGSRLNEGFRPRGVIDELRVEAGIYNGDTTHADSYERKGRPRYFKHMNDEDRIKHVLDVLWKDVVRPIIHALEMYMNDSPLKVSWCPTGIFSFLPLHAAGTYNSDMSSIESTFDYLISSYLPTGNVLAHNKTPIDTTEEFKMMVVIDSDNLPNTIHELTAIEKHVDPDCLVKMGTQEYPALVESAASNLSNVSIAHFACHGKQMTDKPLDSALILKDGNLKISRIMEERIPNAALAFLCACETAVGDKDLPDEAMHLGATLLFSGFQEVVATMWSIADEDGPIVADTFYEHLFKDHPKKPNTEAAAEAIHTAITKLRKRGVGFMRWVPFIHLGR
ncbi:CHAT domain-containing protein [Cyathus striatus]|nr:CHAT domain-containing protein [Cyathus striatus]